MKKALLLATLPVLLIAGCNKDGASGHDVAWFTAHPAERAAMMQKCANNQGDLKNSPDCVNAQQADQNQILDPSNTNTPKL